MSRPFYLKYVVYVLLLLAVGAGAYAAGARQRGVFPPRLSGAQLVVQLLGEPDIAKASQSPTVLYAQRYAEGYVAGVVDATEGRNWCAPAMKPGEIDDRVWAEVQRRPRASLPANAGTMLVELYAAKFPCP